MKKSLYLALISLIHIQAYPLSLTELIKTGISSYQTNSYAQNSFVRYVTYGALCLTGYWLTDSATYTLTHREKESNPAQNSFTKEHHIVYHPNYSFNFGPFNALLQKLHPFDMQKYKRIYESLTCNNQHFPQNIFYTPKQKVSDEDLLIVHTPRYLKSLRWPSAITKAIEVPIPFVLPNMVLQSRLLNPMRWATQGTLDAAFLALKNNWAINIGGGYHHAERDRGMGFCVYGDIQLAAKKVLEQHPEYHILIIDLDAHRGNGHEDYFKDTFNKPERKVHIFDMYNNNIYPPTSLAPLANRIDKAVTMYNNNFTTGHQYLTSLGKELPDYLETLSKENAKPNLIIYNAGTDVFKHDPLGGMPLSKNDIIKRDQYVFQVAEQNNIPIVMVTSGGYTLESADIVADSIKAIVQSKQGNS